jgi:hypothetical protein
LALPRLIWEDKVWPQILAFSILHWADFFKRLTERARALSGGPSAPEEPETLQQTLEEPVKRIVILFISMFLGIFASMKFHSFDGIFFILLAFKTWFDLYAYFKARR